MSVLMIGGGSERGLALARSPLTAEEPPMDRVARGRAAETIKAVGAECYVGTPDVVGTIRFALENVTVLCWLLGTAEHEDPEARGAVRLAAEDAAGRRPTPPCAVSSSRTPAPSPTSCSPAASTGEKNKIPRTCVPTAATSTPGCPRARRAIDSLRTAVRATPQR
ncbi:hypothetical protein GKE82_00020 [Conexibacter sp. W3-3-2]|uniref:hypothetical protein n=1 Tax=Conexibacter sp. W3-3-2 TaxID=2675227 RepID=UPI0012B78CDD|nr:hypothetical protein [Conexibacter sp. W3-3-2]MTD42731.1 hypothetical protein [Conexibacter sp. W3-3-2]